MIDNFHLFAEAVNKQFLRMSEGELFTVDVDDLYETYLAAFPAGTNPLFRVRTEHDCSCCKNFIRNIGHVVGVVDRNIQTVWDVAEKLPHPYNAVARRMSDVVNQLPINGIYRTRESRYGARETYGGTNEDDTLTRYQHFWGDVPKRNRPARPDKERGDANTAAQVFRRGLDELSLAACQTVMDLIDANALYRGSEKRGLVQRFHAMKSAYDQVSDKDAFVWLNAVGSISYFRTDVIGTLVDDLSKGTELEAAVRMYESKVAPQNYRRTTALITSNMIEKAVSTLQELGLESTVERRMARISDVSVNDILFVDNAVRGQMRGGIAGLLLADVKTPAPDLKHATAIGIDDFIRDVLPSASSVSLLVQNRHVGNFVTLTAPVHADDAAARLFQWNNGFAWSYEGDVADSIKQRVKRAGGNVDNAALRVSLSWSNFDDLDVHCLMPNRGEIFYGNKANILDVDMNAGHGHTRSPVENMSWTNATLVDGVYRVWVNQFFKRENIDVGFTIELETAAGIRQWNYDRAALGDVRCLEIHVRNKQVTAVQAFPGLKPGTGDTASQSIWNVNTETLVPVDTIMNSPNHWHGQTVGNKHWFFILKECRNPNATRGIYNEFLNPALAEHRKVFEVLGSKTKCEPTADQLSGVGFSAGRGDSVTAVIKNRAYNIQF